MAEWIQVDPTAVSPSSLKDVHGVELNVQISPYDVPRQVRGNYDTSLTQFVIEFRYLGDEPLRDQRLDQHVTLQVGRNSGRLYEIHVDVDSLRAQKVQLRLHLGQVVSEGIRQLAASRPERTKNYELARQILEEHREELLEPLGA